MGQIKQLITMLLVLFISSDAMAGAGNWQSDADDGTGTSIAAGVATLISGAVEPALGGPALFLHIANGNTTNSDLFNVPLRMTAVVCLNARVGTPQAANTLTVSVERSIAFTPTTAAGSSHRIDNTQLTGAAGSAGCIKGIPPGDYWIDVLLGPGTDAALVEVRIDHLSNAY